MNIHVRFMCNVQCCCVKIMLLKSSHVECVPKSASALWIIVPFCCWQSLATRQQGLLNDGCMGAVRFCGWCCWMLHVLTGTLCCRTQRLHYTPRAQGQPRSWSNHLPPEPLHFTPSPTWNADESSGVNSQWQYFFWHRVS